MNEYFIGAGAVLTGGPASSIGDATLHLQTDPRLAAVLGAVIIDFEGASVDELSRIVIAASGWSRGRFQREIVQRLLARGDSSLCDVLVELARAAGVSQVHCFARWLPDAALCEALRAKGLEIIAHPLEAIGQVSLVSGQRRVRWQAA
jgi:hypothetical protein